jgi:hypothetical protein
MDDSVSLSTIQTPLIIDYEEVCRESRWLGHVYSIGQDLLLHIFDKIRCVVSTVFHVLTAVCNDPVAMIDVLKKLKEHVLPYIELKKGIPDDYHKLKTMMLSSTDIIESLQLAADIDYFVNVKFRKHHGPYFAGRVTLFAAHAGVCYLWLLKADFIKKLASSISKIRLLTISAFCMTYACFAVDSIRKLIHAETIVHKNYAQLELAKNVSNLVLNIMIMIGTVNIAPLCVMGCLCIAFGISCVIYQQDHQS